MARNSAGSEKDDPAPEAESQGDGMGALAARFLDLWQRNLLAWSNETPLPPQKDKP